MALDAARLAAEVGSLLFTHSSRSRFAARLNSGVRCAPNYVGQSILHSNCPLCSNPSLHHGGAALRVSDYSCHLVRTHSGIDPRQSDDWRVVHRRGEPIAVLVCRLLIRSSGNSVRVPWVALVSWLAHPTIHSSRSRSAGRLNSGVRLHGNFNPRARPTMHNSRLQAHTGQQLNEFSRQAGNTDAIDFFNLLPDARLRSPAVDQGDAARRPGRCAHSDLRSERRDTGRLAGLRRLTTLCALSPFAGLFFRVPRRNRDGHGNRLTIARPRRPCQAAAMFR